MKDIVTPYLKDILGTTTKIATWIKVVAITLFVVCVVLSFHYLFINFPRKTDTANLSFDYVGMLIGIYGILVTLLVGWQIFSNLKEKERVDRLVSENEQLKREVLDYKSSITPRLSKMEDCCEKRGVEIQNLDNEMNMSFDKLSAVNECFLGNVYGQILFQSEEPSTEYLYITALRIVIFLNRPLNTKTPKEKSNRFYLVSKIWTNA